MAGANPMTHRLMPPADGLHPTITVNGRTYSCASGSTIDVPDQDMAIMICNGWISAADGGVGLASARPTNPKFGQEFHDLTLNLNVKWDGKNWRNPNTGAVA